MRAWKCEREQDIQNLDGPPHQAVSEKSEARILVSCHTLIGGPSSFSEMEMAANKGPVVVLDASCISDGKILELRGSKGWAGFGGYLHLICLMRTNGGSLPESAVSVSGVDAEIVNECLRIGLFFRRDGMIGSDRLIRDIEAYEARVNAFRSGAKDTNAKRYARRGAKRSPTVNQSIYLKESISLKDSGVKDSEQKANDRKAYGSHVKLSDQEYQALIAGLRGGEMDLKRLIASANDYCASRGKRYKDWAATIRNWARRDGSWGAEATPRRKHVGGVDPDRVHTPQEIMGAKLG